MTSSPADVLLTVNGDQAFQARVRELSYPYPFETRFGGPLSIRLRVSLPVSAPTTEVKIQFSTPAGEAATSVWNSGNLTSDPSPRQASGSMWAAHTSADPSLSVATLGVRSHSFPDNADTCFGFDGFRPRGHAWTNVTVSDSVQYYVELRSSGAEVRHLLVTAKVVGGMTGHVYWTLAPFDLEFVICKPTAAADFEVSVEGPM